MFFLCVFTELTFYKYIIDIWDENYHVFQIHYVDFGKLQFLLGNNVYLTDMVTRENKQNLLTIEKDKKLPSVHLKLLASHL